VEPRAPPRQLPAYYAHQTEYQCNSDGEDEEEEDDDEEDEEEQEEEEEEEEDTREAAQQRQAATGAKTGAARPRTQEQPGARPRAERKRGTRTMMCRDCGVTRASWGLPSTGRATLWCSPCARANHKHEGAIIIRNSPCEDCGAATCNYGLPPASAEVRRKGGKHSGYKRCECGPPRFLRSRNRAPSAPPPLTPLFLSRPKRAQIVGAQRARQTTRAPKTCGRSSRTQVSRRGLDSA
jgi:hypothetical protein